MIGFGVAAVQVGWNVKVARTVDGESIIAAGVSQGWKLPWTAGFASDGSKVDIKKR